MNGFTEIQSRLGEALAANTPGSTVPHVLVALPSLSVGESLLSHYADRIPALEHRYLLAQLMLPRVDSSEFVFISCQAPTSQVLSADSASLRLVRHLDTPRSCTSLPQKFSLRASPAAGGAAVITGER